MSTITVKEVVEHARRIANNEHEDVRPGQPFTFSEASTEGDMVWQGDLGIGLVKKGVPKGYVKKDVPLAQLVPGKNDTLGSRHCLASTQGVTMWVPEVWDDTVFDGPYLELKNGATITHPVHGDVTIPECFNYVQVVYQKEYDQILARERRAKD